MYLIITKQEQFKGKIGTYHRRYTGPKSRKTIGNPLEFQQILENQQKTIRKSTETYENQQEITGNSVEINENQQTIDENQQEITENQQES